MIKKYNQYIKENNIVYSSDEIDPYGEEDWDDEDLTPILRIAKKTGLLYDQMTVLDCSNKNLTNLEGIENLINLEYLDCDSNHLTTLEGIENCKKLTHLYCNDNNLTSLEGIENLVNLKVLWCKFNNFSNEYEQYLKEYCKNNNISLFDD